MPKIKKIMIVIRSIENRMQSYFEAYKNDNVDIWLTQTNTNIPLPDTEFLEIIKGDKNGTLAFWLLLHHENLAYEQKERALNMLITNDSENQYIPFAHYIFDIPFAHYIFGISKEELEERLNQQKVIQENDTFDMNR